MVVFAGQGDARRSMALLWDAGDSPEARPGPKPGLSVERIVDAAIAVADAEGMAALSMRAVGERLGRSAMALYTYVPGKGELVDLMYDRALGELPTRYDLTAGWRAALTAWAEDTCACYLRHPWLLLVSQARPVLGPNEYLTLETLLGVLRETGLDRDVLRRVVGTLFHFVRGAAQTIAEARQAEAATGVSDDAWWLDRSGTLKEAAPDFAARFPNVTWLEAAAAAPRSDDESGPYLEREARKTFHGGLAIILDGIEAA
ncbi:TetR/AcrR family transcriptional regulator C-terminal domain-containing protein [Nonomuraea cavernae]|uniref:TetR family transcriptional regulator n=1 Tax=Nonomuraea cavernae TaxID=2045107 RepID=A0A918DFS1_9ACTN|nr:TetR/AcrR family transcriptional regulator C-terminal domain-containing protein [Nonomuraea cavernae]MCA2184547.1 TetR/AcrR family transcriptional regulator C-terminal domain-containing protein [Nonomuraea cavernae]GGO63460.1 TetR family transcriptional regulator [Nonomuraea cavernae]